jgi:hypothetical protein
MDEFIVELVEFGDPSLSAVIESLWFSEVKKIQVVGVDEGLVGGTVNVMFPFPRGANDSEEFSIIDFVAVFRASEGLGKEADGVVFASGVPHILAGRGGW